MTSPILNEGFYTGAFMVSESPGALSRDGGVLINTGTAAATYQGGLVLSLDVTGTPTVVAVGGLAGKGTLGSVVQGAAMTVGTYTAIANSASTFAVSNPGNDAMAQATVGTVYADAEIGFTIASGATAFAVGDTFNIVIPAGDGNFVPYSGAHPASAVLFNQVKGLAASGTRKVAVIARNAEVNASELQWDASIINAGTATAGLQATALAQLKAKGIISR